MAAVLIVYSSRVRKPICFRTGDSFVSILCFFAGGTCFDLILLKMENVLLNSNNTARFLSGKAGKRGVLTGGIA